MKVQIVVTDEEGGVFEGSVALVRVSKSGKRSKVVAKPSASPHKASKLTFSLNLRAFMNTHAKGKSGSRKLTLLLAHIAQGKAGQEVSNEQIISSWNRMKGVLGGTYNSAHAVRAQDEGWLDSPKRGCYALSSTWQEVMRGE